MENMREQNWQSLLFVISIVVFGTGIYFYLKNRHARHLSSVNPVESTQTKEIAGKPETKSMETEHAHEQLREHVEEIESAKQTNEEVEEENDYADREIPKKAKAKKLQVKIALPMSVPAEHEEKHASNLCESYGIRENLENFKVDMRVWNKIIMLFHKSKQLLLTRLALTEKNLPEETVKTLKNQLTLLKIAPPPWKEEPHLKWQSLGIWVRKENNTTSIHIGEAFFHLINAEPKRAEFEMVRLVAQSWAPCELARLGVKSLWDPLLSCLKLDNESCDDSFYSESGWAASSALGVSISPLKCTLPGFSTPEGSQCLASIPFPAKIAEEHKAEEHKKEEKKEGAKE